MIARTKNQFEEMGIQCFLNHEGTTVDFEGKRVEILNRENGKKFWDNYDKLMIATGSKSVVPNFKNKEIMGVHTVKTMEDGIYLKEVSASQDIKEVVIVGGGYIGVECAEAYLHLGKKVTIIEAADRLLNTFEYEISELAEKELELKGVRIVKGEKVVGFTGDNWVKFVETENATYPVQLVIVAVGVKPNTEFLKGTKIHLAENGGVIVNRKQETSIKDVYSAGDCALCYNSITKGNSYFALGTVANKCGRIAGANIAGEESEFFGALGTAAVKVCDLELARTGLSMEEAKKHGFNSQEKFIVAYDHPGYYPGKTSIAVKIIYDGMTKQIIGAQACGQKGAVLRIDVFAAAIQAKMKTYELGNLDLAYAPPFAGVWDAIHIACNAAK